MPAHGQGDMVVADHLPGRGVEAFPAGAGQVDFRPGVGCALAPRKRGRIEIAADKTRRQSQAMAGFDEQSRKVAAGTGTLGQGSRRCLDARFFPWMVGEVEGDGPVDPVE